MKKLLSLLLVLSLSVSLCTFTVHAEELTEQETPAVQESTDDVSEAPSTESGNMDPDTSVIPGQEPDMDSDPDAGPDTSTDVLPDTDQDPEEGPGEGQEGDVNPDGDPEEGSDVSPDGIDGIPGPGPEEDPSQDQTTPGEGDQPVLDPEVELPEQIDPAILAAPVMIPEMLQTPERWDPEEYAFDYTHWVDSRFGNSMVGRLIGNEDGSWYTYCVDEDLAYPSEGGLYLNIPREEIPYSDQQLVNDSIRVNTDSLHTFRYGDKLYQESGDSVPRQAQLAKVLEAGYPHNGVAAINSIADSLNYGEAQRAFFTQNAVWAVLSGNPAKAGGAYASALYEYATAGTVAGKPITDPTQLVITDGVDSDGQISLTYQEDTQLWAGSITFNAVPGDLVLAEVSDGVEVSTVGGAILHSGDTVTDTTLLLTASSAIRGAIRFSYNARQTVDAETLTLFETNITDLTMESEGADRFLSADPYQRMLGYTATESREELTALVFGVNQPAPEPGPEPMPEPDPDPTPEPTPTPVPTPDDGRDDEGYDDDRPTPPVDIPEETPPLADLPEEVPAAEEEEAPVDLEELEEPEVPMAQAPETGDAAWLLAAAAALSGAGLLWLALSARRRPDGE